MNFPTGLDSLAPVQALEPPVVRDGTDSTRRRSHRRLPARGVGRRATADPARRRARAVGRRRPPRRAHAAGRCSCGACCRRTPRFAFPSRRGALLDVRAPIPWWWWALAALAALLIGLGIWWWRRRRRRAAGPTGDPFADAQAAFERIERLRLPEAGEPGRHAALMTDVVRRYLAGRHRVGVARAHDGRAARRDARRRRRCRSISCAACSTRSIR